MATKADHSVMQKCNISPIFGIIATEGHYGYKWRDTINRGPWGYIVHHGTYSSLSKAKDIHPNQIG